MFYNARIDEEKQRFVIEDREGEIIAFLPMPTQKFPNPGLDVLLTLEGNRIAWYKIVDLIQDTTN